MKRVYKTGFAPLLLLLLAGSSHAQSPPLPGPPPSNLPPPIVGFVSPYEIMRTLRAAGFEPLSPPLREGTDYVLRATDFRGILMHVVVDARTAAIRDVTRIVPGPGRYGQYYGAPPYGAAPIWTRRFRRSTSPADRSQHRSSAADAAARTCAAGRPGGAVSVAAVAAATSRHIGIAQIRQCRSRRNPVAACQHQDGAECCSSSGARRRSIGRRHSIGCGCNSDGEAGCNNPGR